MCGGDYSKNAIACCLWSRHSLRNQQFLPILVSFCSLRYLSSIMYTEGDGYVEFVSLITFGLCEDDVACEYWVFEYLFDFFVGLFV